MSSVFHSDSEQMLVRERLYLLLLFDLSSRAVAECTAGLQTVGTKNDGGDV